MEREKNGQENIKAVPFHKNFALNERKSDELHHGQPQSVCIEAIIEQQFDFPQEYLYKQLSALNSIKFFFLLTQLTPHMGQFRTLSILFSLKKAV